MKIDKFVRYITDADYRFIINANRGIYDYLSDEDFLKRRFKASIGSELNIHNPKTFNEKLQWLKLYDRNPIYTGLVDKIEVKKIVGNIIGHDYIIPTIRVWESVDDIDINSLPDKFVIKCSHDSGSTVVCKDKSRIDLNKLKRKLRKKLKRNYFFFGREWPYKNVKPRILAEEYLDNGGAELVDYKVLCFNGEPKLIEVHSGRFSQAHTQDMYDIQWNKTDISQPSVPMSKSLLSKPIFLDSMLELSKILSKGKRHVRVDWYYAIDKLYFGELTFYDGSGFDSFDRIEDDLLLGEWIQLPKLSNTENGLR